ncbi:MFS transporter [Acinetobacter sp. ANC 3832]|uniref:MFS transporter n=1 Tax=Acinetobacter sp. ANC 3832 TaxID=1977874 RepID=UPI000A35A890|nr:MFS transporter [Acinetobacter sp. ANC 3832]OTG94639.1 MFS transporter [Acinetobacter sp. ANC 3832]
MNEQNRATQDASWGELLSGKNGLRTVALTGGVALHAINIYIVTTILPSIVQDIGGMQYYAWNTTLFVITSIIGSAIASQILAKFGPRSSYLLGLVIFAIGSIWCGFALNMPVLLVGRVLQGFGGGILLALSYALIRIVFEQRLWSRAMGVTSGMWGVATLVGPAIGGLFAQYGHWRWAFWSVVPVAILIAVIVIKHINITQQKNQANITIPYAQIGLLVVSISILTLMSLTDVLWINLVGVLATILSIVAIGTIDNKSKTKLMPTGAYTLKHPIGVIFSVMILLIAGLATEVYIPYFLQVIQQTSPLIAGYLTAIMAAGWTLGAFITANKTPKQVVYIIRYSPVMIISALVALALFIPMPNLMHSALLISLFVLALICVGFGIGLCWPHLAIHVFNSAEKGEENLASSSVVTIQLFAMALATAVAGIVVNNAGISYPGGIEGARNAALWLFALFAIAPLMTMTLVRRIKYE